MENKREELKKFLDKLYLELTAIFDMIDSFQLDKDIRL